MSTAVVSPFLCSVRLSFRAGYRDHQRGRVRTRPMRAWDRVAGWREVSRSLAVTIADQVAAGESPSAALLEAYRLTSARYDRAVERARAAS